MQVVVPTNFAIAIAQSAKDKMRTRMSTFKRFLLYSAITVAGLTTGAAHAQSVYEDGEVGADVRWVITDTSPTGAAVTSLFDSDLSSNVVELSGTGSATANAYLLGGFNTATGFNNSSEFFLSWNQRTSASYIINIRLDTEQGPRYIRYKNTDSDLPLSGNTVEIGLGSNTNNDTWTSFSRDLQQDLFSGEPGNTILAVNAFFVRGQMRLDDITLSDGNLAPVADAGSDRIFEVDDSQSLDGSGSVDNDGSIVSYEWRESGTLIATGATPSISLPIGEYLIELVIVDDDGATATDVVNVSILANSGSGTSGTIYEDAENGNTDGWTILNSSPPSAVVSNVFDNDLNSRVIALTDTGTSTNNSYMLGWFNSTTGWNNTQEHILNWKMLTVEDYSISVRVNTNVGAKYIRYRNVDVNGGLTGSSIDIGLGSATADGSWQSFSRDLQADINTALPSAVITEVNGVYVRGSVRFDDIILSDGSGAPSNTPPVADAGDALHYTVGEVQTLDGSGSSDSDGTIVTYEWSVGGSVIANGASPTVALEVGVYDVALTVTDNEGAIDTDSVTVTVVDAAGNMPPVAEAGNALTFTVGDDQILNGSGSSDSDGTISTYEWSVAGSVIATGVSATVTPALADGVYEVTLTVTDNEGATATDTVNVTIIPAGMSMAIYEDAETPDTNGWEVTDANPAGALITNVFDTELQSNVIETSGTGSQTSNAFLLGATSLSDPDIWNNTTDFNLTWKHKSSGSYIINVRVDTTNGPRYIRYRNRDGNDAQNGTTINIGLGSDTGDGTWRTFNRDLQADLLTSSAEAGNTITAVHGFLLRGYGRIDDIKLYSNGTSVNVPPIANAGLAATFTVGDDQILDGSGSSDSDGTITTYEWSFAGAIIATGVNPTLATALEVGVHTVTLTVTDDDGATATDTVTVTVEAANLPPTAEAGEALTFTEGDDQILSAAGSTDSDGTITTYEWSFAGAVIATGANPTLATALEVGVHVVTLTVTDDDGATATDTVTITVEAANLPPTAEAGEALTFTEGDDQILSAAGSTDSDGTIAAYEWSVSGTVIATGTNPTLATALEVGVHIVTLTVTDDDGATATDTVTVTVEAANVPPVAVAGADLAYEVGEEQTLNGAASSDSDGSIVNFSWSVAGVEIATGDNPTLLPSLPLGTHTVTLTVTDDMQAEDSDDVIVTVTGRALATYATPYIETTGFIPTTPFTNSTTAIQDNEGSALEHDNLWIVDDEFGIVSQIDVDTGDLLGQVLPAELLTATEFNSTTLASSDRIGDMEAMAYDPVNDYLYLINGKCCDAVPNTPTIFRFERQSDNSFAPTVWQSLPAGSDYSGAAADPLTGTLWLGSGRDIVSYDFDTNTTGTPVTISVTGNIYGLGFSEDGVDLMVVTSSRRLFRIDFASNTRVSEYNIPIPGVDDSRSVVVRDDGFIIGDGYGVPSSDPLALAMIRFDQLAGTPPVAVINAPLDNDVLLATPVITGSATDDSGVSQIRVYIRNNNTGEYLVDDGTYRSNSFIFLADVDAAGATSTNFALTLPEMAPGSYHIRYQAEDDTFLLQKPLPRIDFTINSPPVANAGEAGEPLTFIVGQTQSLDGSGSTDSDGTIVTYEWSVDGTVIATGVTPTLTSPLAEGVHTVTLTVTDDVGATGTDTVIVVVEAPNVPPVAEAGNALTFTVGDPQSLDGSASTDSDGTITTYEWSFAGAVIATGVNPTLATALEVGVHTVTLTVTDDDGATATDTVTVTVEAAAANVPPVAEAGNALTFTVGDPQSLDGSASTDSDGTIATYEWSVAGTVFATGVNPTLTNALAEGVHTVTLTVTDDDGAVGTDTVSVTIMPTGMTMTIYEDAETTDVSDWEITDNVPAGATITTVFDTELQSNVIETAGTGSGTANTYTLGGLNQASGGWNNTSEFHISWKIKTDVNYVVNVRVDTTNGLRYIRYRNRDINDTQTNSSINIGLGSNTEDDQWHTFDRDLQADLVTGALEAGNSITAVHGVLLKSHGRIDDIKLYSTGAAANVSPVANAGADVTYVVGEIQVLDGSGSADSDGSITSYDWTLGGSNIATGVNPTLATPLAAGVHVITLTVTDDDAATHTDTVTVTVNAAGNILPVADAGADVNFIVGEAQTLDGSGSTDDSAITAYEWSVSGSVIATGVSPTLSPTLVEGVHTVTLTVTDDASATATDTVEVTVVANQAPIAVAGNDQSIDPTTGISLDGSGSTDADGSIATYSWTEGGIEFATTAQATLAARAVGTYTFDLTVVDNLGTSSTTDSVVVTVSNSNTNTAPVANAGGALTFQVGDPQILDGSASTDADGTIVTYEWRENGDLLGTGAVLTLTSVLPEGGPYIVELTVIDDDGASDIDTVLVTVNANTNEAPQITAQAKIDLVDLDGTSGTTFEGIGADDQAGFGLGAIGDFNDDGFDDFAIGSFQADISGVSNAGQAYVIYGTAAGMPARVLLSSLNGTNGFAMNFTGSDLVTDDRVGISIDGAGDMNGDGIADLAVTRYQGDLGGSQAGDAYVIFGSATAMPAVFDMGTINGVNGFGFYGADAADRLGLAVRSAGDFNDDGVDDLVIGAYQADENGNRSGAAYVIFGSDTGFPAAPFDLDTLNGLNGFEINGAAAVDELGGWVGRASDFNGDGFSDVLLGARYADANGVDSGAAYIIFGTDVNLGASIEVTSPDGLLVTQISGAVAGDEVGINVESGGDFNDDGIADILVGAHNAAPYGRSNAGTAYILYGKSAWPSTVSLDTLSSNDGVIVHGANASDSVGKGLYAAGDVDGDGVDDVIIGADNAISNGSGRSGVSYVLYGTTTSDSIIDLTYLEETQGFLINGVGNADRAGRMVSGNIDVNSDGKSDLLISGHKADVGTNVDIGEVYLVYGMLPPGSNQQEISVTGSALETTGLYVVEDTDSVTLSVPSVTLSGDTAGFSQAAILSMLTMPSAALDGSTSQALVEWTFDSGTETFSALTAGQQLVIDYTVTATDNASPAASTDDFITITINGN